MIHDLIALALELGPATLWMCAVLALIITITTRRMT